MADKKIVITEDDLGRNFSVKALEIKNSGGTWDKWVCPDDYKVESKSITKNGTYTVAGTNLYGWDELHVNVPNAKSKVTGKKIPKAGETPDPNDYDVEVDQDGYFTETKAPTKINITTQPSKKSYTDGESISINGAVVKAYCADNTLWEASGYSGGVIPHSELSLEPPTADASQAKDYAVIDGSSHGLDGTIYVNSMKVGDVTNKWTDPDTVIKGFTGAPKAFLFDINGDGRFDLAFASLSPFTYTEARQNGQFPSTTTATSGVYNDRTYYYNMRYSSAAGIGWDENWQVSSPQSESVTRVVAMCLIGMENGWATEGDQDITVKWQRPSDQKVLTDNFTIQVNAETSGEGNNTGGGGGSW